MRVKRGVIHVKKRQKLFRSLKGYRWRRKNTLKLGKTAFLKAGVNAYRDRKRKKRVFRGLWNIKINAGVRPYGLNYATFIHLLKVNKIELDRKILSQLAEFEPKVFEELVKEINK
ncbi:MAG: 50S ribosomal protein L20 [Patescibacteria group bacterium]